MPSVTSGELIPLDSVSTAIAKGPNPPENYSAEVINLANVGAPVKINNFLSPTLNPAAATPGLNNDNSSL